MQYHSSRLLFLLTCIPIQLPLYAMEAKEAVQAEVTYSQAAQAFIALIPAGKPSSSKPATVRPDFSALKAELAAAKAKIALLEQDKTQLAATVAAKETELTTKKNELASSNNNKDTYITLYNNASSRDNQKAKELQCLKESGSALLPNLLKMHTHIMLGIISESLRLSHMTPHVMSYRVARRERLDELEKKIKLLEIAEITLAKATELTVPGNDANRLAIYTKDVLKALKSITSQIKTYLNTSDRYWGHSVEGEFLEHIKKEKYNLEYVSRRLA